MRALPNDPILVQDQSDPNRFNGRRHTTSAKWVSMVADPDGSAAALITSVQPGCNDDTPYN